MKPSEIETMLEEGLKAGGPSLEENIFLKIALTHPAWMSGYIERKSLKIQKELNLIEIATLALARAVSIKLENEIKP